MGKEEIEFNGAKSRIERHARRAGGYSEKSHRHFRTVGKHDGNTIVSTNAHLVKRMSKVLDLLQKKRVSQRAASGHNNSSSLRSALRARLERLINRVTGFLHLRCSFARCRPAMTLVHCGHAHVVHYGSSQLLPLRRMFCFRVGMFLYFVQNTGEDAAI